MFIEFESLPVELRQAVLDRAGDYCEGGRGRLRLVSRAVREEADDACFELSLKSPPCAEAIAAQVQPNVKARDSEPNAATVCGFRFEYRAEGGSGFYFNGKRVASTREGLERMGPAILVKVCR